MRKAPLFQKKKSGQVMILMAMLTTTFIIFFGMVVSVGHLVQAKINLQNAVDLAAMSGASYQARYLNHLALINFRLRQNLRFQLFDFYATQSRFNRSFQQALGGSTIPRTAFGVCQQVPGFVPTGGLTGEAVGETNMCKNVSTSTNNPIGETIPELIASPVITLNPYYLRVNQIIRETAEEIRRQGRNYGGQNYQYVENALRAFNDRQVFQMRQSTKVMTEFSRSFTPGGAAESTVRRTFQANLMNANANDSAKIELWNSEGLAAPSADDAAVTAPGGVGGLAVSKYFERINIQNITVTYVDFCTKDSNSPECIRLGLNKGGGLTTIVGDMTNGGMFMGWSKVRDPSKMFYVMLRAEVRPKLLFWPQGLTPKLVAYAAAKPFGSRIGPPKSLYDQELFMGQMANMKFYPGDTKGFQDAALIRQAVGLIPGGLNGNPYLRPHPGNAAAFMDLVTRPTLYDAAYFNAFPSGMDPSTPLGSSYPNDVALQVVNSSYALADRGAPESPAYHSTPLPAGRNKWYASAEQILSSWSPAVRPEAPSNLSELGRMGYQIKLVSIPQLCIETNNSAREACELARLGVTY